MSALPRQTVKLEHDAVDAQQAPRRCIRLRCGRARWQIREAWQETLLGGQAPDWFALENASDAAPVKTGEARTTWRVMCAGRTVFAKVTDHGYLRHRLKHHLVGDALVREWRMSLQAELRGVPAARSLALGIQDGDPPRVALLSEGSPGALRLLDAWAKEVEGAVNGGRRIAAAKLIHTVARLFAAAHERGFVHGDAHPNNVLISGNLEGQRRGLFVDVHSAKLTRRPPSLRRSLCALAQLDQYFHRRATKTERLRFLRGYLTQRPSLGEPVASRTSTRKLLTTLRQASVSHADRLARTRDRRLRRNGAYFATLRLRGGWTATVVLRLERRHVYPEEDVPDRHLPAWRALLDPLTRRLSDVSPNEATSLADGLQIELSRIEGFWHRLLTTLQGPAHRSAFERCHRERHRDLRNELILGCAEHRIRGLIDASILIRPARSEPDAAGRTDSTETKDDG